MIKITPIGDQDYTNPASSDSDASDNQDNRSQPNEHVVADDTQETNEVVTDAVFPNNYPLLPMLK